MPHKQFCGRRLEEDTIDHVERPPQNDDWMKPFDDGLAEYDLSPEDRAAFRKQAAEMMFPEPVPGYKRSIALQLQIKALKETVDSHYMVCVDFEREVYYTTDVPEIFDGLDDGSTFGMRCPYESTPKGSSIVIVWRSHNTIQCPRSS